MAYSTKTRTIIQRIAVSYDDDLYPDRTATDATIKGSGTASRLPETVPTTTRDMSKMFKWEHGTKLYGTYAKMHIGGKSYRRDINRDFGKQDDYKDIYLDTFKPISEGYEEWDAYR